MSRPMQFEDRLIVALVVVPPVVGFILVAIGKSADLPLMQYAGWVLAGITLALVGVAVLAILYHMREFWFIPVVIVINILAVVLFPIIGLFVGIKSLWKASCSKT